jgi:LAO/AO transport system kinase
VNANALERLRSSRSGILPAARYTEGIRAGDRGFLSRAITLVESSLPDHQLVAQQIIEGCLPFSGNSMRIGITGVPGAGKSTFIEALGTYLTGMGKKLAVLAIDPSSARSKGSILGDKTRMEMLANDVHAFIRPSPAAGSLGGVARKTRESIILCEAAGFDTIFVETVGVGQSEIAVHAMVDFFLLLMISGAGDELQGIKRGIMEMADGIAINKADGDNINAATRARAEYSNALHLFPPHPSGWEPRVLTCSALNGAGIADVWAMISEYRAKMKSSGFLEGKRRMQDTAIMRSSVLDHLSEDFFHNEKVRSLLPSLESDIEANRISAYVAAQQLLAAYFATIKGSP